MDILALSGGRAALGKAILAEGTNANTFKTTAAVPYTIGGFAYSKAATDNIAFAMHASATIKTVPVSSTILYLICVDASGTVTVVQSDIVLTADLGDNLALQIPPVPDDVVPIGMIKVQTNASTTFTPATTDLGAGGITDTYYDFALGVPNTPITS